MRAKIKFFRFVKFFCCFFTYCEYTRFADKPQTEGSPVAVCKSACPLPYPALFAGIKQKSRPAHQSGGSSLFFIENPAISYLATALMVLLPEAMM
jgi:hypothetical protein